MNRYGNHEIEWADEENQLRYEREQARRVKIDPRDPDYIATDEEERGDKPK